MPKSALKLFNKLPAVARTWQSKASQICWEKSSQNIYDWCKPNSDDQFCRRTYSKIFDHWWRGPPNVVGPGKLPRLTPVSTCLRAVELFGGFWPLLTRHRW